MIEITSPTTLLNIVLQPFLTIASFLLPSESPLLLSLSSFLHSIIFSPFESVAELLSQNFCEMEQGNF